MHDFENLSRDELIYRCRNLSESVRWYQVLTQTSDGAMLRGEMKAKGILNPLNDPMINKDRIA